MPMSDEEAKLKVEALTNLPDEPVDDNSDVYSDISDLSDALSYVSVPISNDEKLRRELLKQQVSENTEDFKFNKYNYENYKSNYDLPLSSSFNLELNKNAFPHLKKNWLRISVVTCLIISAILLIVIPIVLIKKSDSELQRTETLKLSHTIVYTEYWNSNRNANNMFYNNYTLGYLLFKDPCVVSNDLPLLRTIINSEIQCTGDWCINNKFMCDTTLDCYDLNYIIPTDDQEFPGTCKNITGNIVFTWKQWSTQLLNLQVSDQITEITTVLGFDTLSYVRDLISNCNLGSRC
jgi:hypothetical protein